MPILGFDAERPLSVVPKTIPRILHRKSVQKRSSVSVILRRYKGGFLCPHQINQIVVGKFPSIINMSYKILFIHNTDTIACFCSIQFKDPVLFIVRNIHKNPPFLLTLRVKGLFFTRIFRPDHGAFHCLFPAF